MKIFENEENCSSHLMHIAQLHLCVFQLNLCVCVFHSDVAIYHLALCIFYFISTHCFQYNSFLDVDFNSHICNERLFCAQARTSFKATADKMSENSSLLLLIEIH